MATLLRRNDMKDIDVPTSQPLHGSAAMAQMRNEVREYNGRMRRIHSKPHLPRIFSLGLLEEP
jgi:hypothetical protein